MTMPDSIDFQSMVWASVEPSIQNAFITNNYTSFLHFPILFFHHSHFFFSFLKWTLSCPFYCHKVDRLKSSFLSLSRHNELPLVFEAATIYSEMANAPMHHNNKQPIQCTPCKTFNKTRIIGECSSSSCILHFLSHQNAMHPLHVSDRQNTHIRLVIQARTILCDLDWGNEEVMEVAFSDSHNNKRSLQSMCEQKAISKYFSSSRVTILDDWLFPLFSLCLPSRHLNVIFFSEQIAYRITHTHTHTTIILLNLLKLNFT